jgi:trimeric autotransporter adhesin
LEGSFVYGGTTYTSGMPNDWWGNSTLSLGKFGTAPVGSGVAPGYYTTNTLLRVAFTGSGANAVTYYACQERFNNGSTRNCTVIGTGTYTISTLGDARVLTLNNPPAQAAPLSYNRVYVERGGAVYVGYQNKLLVSNSARLNTTAANALFAQLGITPEDPSVPMALTARSYQGTWDIRSASATDWSQGTSVFIGPAGNVSCQDRATATSVACTLTVTDPATGAFTYSSAGETVTGTASFLAGTVSATSSKNGALVGYRR